LILIERKTTHDLADKGVVVSRDIATYAEDSGRDRSQWRVLVQCTFNPLGEDE